MRKPDRQAWSGLQRACAFALAAVLLASCAHDGAPVQTASPPPKPATLCGATSALGAADRDAICGPLTAMKEPALQDDPRGGYARVYRVVLVPAGQAALSIRFLPGNGIGSGHLVVRRWSHGKLDIDRTVSLSAKDDLNLLAVVDSSAAHDLPQAADAPTVAACRALSFIAMEGFAGGQYRFAVSRCIALRALRDIADGFLNVASRMVPELKQGLEESLD